MEPFNEYFTWNMHHWRTGEDALLSEQERQELFDLMNGDDLPETALSAEQADGYLTASVIGPELMLVHEWMEALFGQPTLPLPHDSARQDRLLELLRQRCLDIQLRLNMADHAITPDAIFTPLNGEVPDEDRVTPCQLGADGQRIGNWPLKEWAQGFHQAMQDDARWEDLAADPSAYALLAPVLLYHLGHNPDRPDFQLDQDKALPAALIESVYAMRRWWQDHRRQAAQALRARNTLRRETPKPGRNDPCPCGSGKKYKKCCGA